MNDKLYSLIEFVLQEYCLGKCISVNSISQGYANENYKIITNTGNYLFRICKEQVYEMVEYEMRLMQSLKMINFPTAYPIQRKDGEYITESAFGNIVLYEFKQGSEPSLGKIVLSEIASAIGRLSILPDKEDFKKKNVINLHDCLQMINNFPNAKCQYPEIFKDFEQIITFLKDSLIIELPKGVIHGDVFPDNTLFQDNNLIAIIDFEEANYDHLLFDVGMTINGFCFRNNNLQQDLLKPFLNSYQQIRPLSPLEIELLNQYIIWGAVGMAYWHLRHLVKRPFKTQQNRIEELINRAKSLQKQLFKTRI